ncbi:MFS transporter [Streptomyces sp. NPDC004435]|uniref:MFS transporter n=1 Tax=Streptomyces sp. NPDC004435 TaxID=3364701 RepID=UPI0036AFF807
MTQTESVATGPEADSPGTATTRTGAPGTAATRTDSPGAAAPRRQTLILTAVLLAVFVVPTSISGTGVALPHIGADIGASLVPLQWVVNAFNVAFACLTLAWGSIADIIGRIRAFTIGAALYAAASLVSVFAANVYVLDAARALAGIGGAALFACGAALLSTVFEGPARGRAFALFGTVAGLGVSFGPSLSGLLVETAGWRWVFALHAVVLGLVLLAVPAMSKGVRETRDQDARIDVAGTALFVVAMLLLTTGIAQGSQWGWASPGVLGLFAGTILALAAFAAVEKRHTHPMLDLGAVADRRFLALCLVPVAGSFAFVTMLTYLPSYLTAAGGYSSGAAGLIMVLLTFPMLVLPLLAAKLVAKGVRAMTVIFVSLACLVVGVAGLSLFSPDVDLALVALPMLITGAGYALAAGLVDGEALSLIPPERAGMAAGFLNTLRLGSEAVAVAVYGSLLATLLTGRNSDGIAAFPGAGDAATVAGTAAGGNIDGPAEAVSAAQREGFVDFLVDAYDSSFHTVIWVLAATCLVLLAAIALLLRRGGGKSPTTPAS